MSNYYKKVGDKKNFIWNMVGSSIYSAISVILSIFVIRVMGEKAGGVVAIAITISQLLMYIAYYEIRTYQVTDVSRKFTFQEYHTAKVIVCIAMIIASVAYVLIAGYDIQKAWIVLLMCVYRMFDSYADLYEGTFQLDGRLDLSGKSMTFRTIFSVGVFIIVVLCVKDIILALILAIIAAIIGVIAFDMIVIKPIYTLKLKFDWKKIKEILVVCFPLFLGIFLWIYILSAGRLAIDANMSSEYQAYYQTLFLPVSLINLFITFFFKPLLVKLSVMYAAKQFKRFSKTILMIVGLVALVTLACMACAYFVGIPALEIVVKCDLGPYRNVLTFLMLAGGFNSASYFLYYIITIMRKTRIVFITYVSAAVITLFLSMIFVKLWGIPGAALSFFIVAVYLCLMFCISILLEMRKNKEK